MLMKTWLSLHASALRDTLRRLAANPLATLLNLAVMGVALSLPTGLYLGLTQLQDATRDLSSDPQVTLFLALDAAPGDVGEVQDRLRTQSGVRSFRFIPKDRALADLKRSAGVADLLDTLRQNPLPDAFVVTVKDNSLEALERLREEARHWPKVEHVQLDSEWARKLDAAVRLGRTLILLFGVLLASALVAVTFNTIRLQILTRREEIEVVKLIGATNGFIRRPFLYFGTLQGLGGGLVAWLILTGGVWLLNRNLETLVGLYSESIFIQGLTGSRSAAMLGLSAALGWLGAWLAVSRYLWQIEPK
jgi:cell division transport system permease protein